MGTEDICGETTQGDSICEFSPSYPDGKCGHHTDHETQKDKANRSNLEKKPEIADLIEEEIEHGATVSEALAEVERKTGIYISQSTHQNWMQKGKSPGEDDIYTDYRSGVMRARKSGKRTERESIKRRAIEENDLRLQWKIHMQKYGDEYTTDIEETEDMTVPFAVPEELIDEWQQQAPKPE